MHSEATATTDAGELSYSVHDGTGQLENSYSRLQSSLHQWLVKPRTRKGQLYCWISWAGIVVFAAVLFWQLLPKFVDHGEACMTDLQHSIGWNSPKQ